MNPADCMSMAQVRAGVDAVDRALVDLLVQRFAFMDAAARIKPSRDAVRDEGRKAQVIANVAAANGLPEGLAAELWEILVEASISYELTRWDALHNPQGCSGASDGARTRDLRRDRPAL